jgi:hypothetical protein
MRNYSRIMLLALVVALVLPACKKYPEGPAVSFRSKTARLVNQWKIEKVISDGQDVTVNYTTAMPNFIAEFKENGDMVLSYTSPGGGTTTWTDQWEFNKDKTGVNITEAGVTVLSTILMLKNDELWLKKTITNTLTTNIVETHYVTN